MFPWPRTRKARALLLQSALLAAIVALLATSVLVTRSNLLDQGIATGFDFLQRSTGWPVNFALIDISARSPYWQFLVAGLLNTLLVGIVGIALATVVGLLVGLARISGNLVLNILGTIYVEIFRNVPLILQVFVWYAVLTHLPRPREAISLLGVGFLSNRGLILPAFNIDELELATLVAGATLLAIAARAARRRHLPGSRHAWPVAVALLAGLLAALLWAGAGPEHPVMSIPELRGLRFVGGVAIKPEFTALLIAIAVFGGAYIGEIVRGGFLAVDRGRIEGGLALGLTPFQVNRLVRIPLALRASLPAIANQYVWLMKATTLGIAIGYPDYFMIVSTSINQSGQTIELLALLMAGFLLINYAIGFVMNRINARIAIKGRSG